MASGKKVIREPGNQDRGNGKPGMKTTKRDYQRLPNVTCFRFCRGTVCVMERLGTAGPGFDGGDVMFCYLLLCFVM